MSWLKSPKTSSSPSTSTTGSPLNSPINRKHNESASPVVHLDNHYSPDISSSPMKPIQNLPNSINNANTSAPNSPIVLLKPLPQTPLSPSLSSSHTPQKPKNPPPPVPPKTYTTSNNTFNPITPLNSQFKSISISTSSPNITPNSSPKKLPSSPLPPIPSLPHLNNNQQHHHQPPYGSPNAFLKSTRSQMSAPGLLQHRTGSPLGSSRMQGVLNSPNSPNGSRRKRGVTVAVSDDLAESRRIVMMGPSPSFQRPRSKSLDILNSWDYLPWEARRESFDDEPTYVDPDDYGVADEYRIKTPRNGTASSSYTNLLKLASLRGSISDDGDRDLHQPSSPSSSTSSLPPPPKQIQNPLKQSFGSISDRPSSPKTISSKIVFELSEDNRQCVVSGLKEQFLEYLCAKTKLDVSFVFSFLATYKYFMETEELFNFLMKRFESNSESGDLRSSSDDSYNDNVRQNIIIIFLIWIDCNFSDFLSNEVLHQQLTQFTLHQNSKALKEAIDKQTVFRLNLDQLYETMRSELLASPRNISSANVKQAYPAHQVQEWLMRHLSIGGVASDLIIHTLIISKRITTSSPQTKEKTKLTVQRDDSLQFIHSLQPRETYSKSFLDHHPHDIAKQLTLMEFSIFQKIQPKELYNKCWTVAKTKFETSPNVMALITMSNRVANWVATEVVTTPHPKKRVEVIKRFITIAEYCRKINNYNTMIEIISGLGNCSVTRLRETWKSLPSRYSSSFKSMQEFFSTTENWKLYRQALKSRDIPCLPYLGLFLQDINFLEDGNSNFVNAPVPPSSPISLTSSNDLNNNNNNIIQHINFKKLTLLSNLIKNLQYFQKHPYHSFTTNLNAQNFLDKDMLILPEKELYDFSKFVESPTNPLNKLNKSSKSSSVQI